MSVSDLKAKAREAFKRKNYDHAVEVYVEAISFTPDDVELWEGLAQASEKRREGRGKSLFGGGFGKLGMATVRDPTKRVVACARSLAKTPDDKAVLMELGEAAEASGALHAAVFAFRAAAKADPDDNVAWKRLGALLYRQGRIKEASDAYGEAVRLDPKDQEAVKMRKNLAAEGALKTSGYETAKSSRDLIKDKEIAGKLEREVRKQLTAEDSLDEVGRLRAELAKGPNPRVRVRLGEVLQQRGDLVEALAEYTAALEQEPTNYDLSVRIGDIRLAQLQEADHAAKVAHEARPGPETEAAWKEARGKLLEARLAEFGRRVREHPTDLSERYKYGATLLMAGRVDEAIGEFQKTVQDPRRKTDSLLRLVDCFERKNMLDLAARQAQKAVEDFPVLTSERAKEVVYRLAEIQERRGAKDDAKKEYMKIYEVDIGYKDVAARIERLSA
jgi:tetratricopeptide (TPR) repeat protein